LGCIFKNKAGNESKYRFYFNNLYLVAEHLRLNPAIMSTVKPVLTTTSEQRPPVNNGQSDPQTSQINTSFIGGTSE
jgi:hypothetical protein